MAEISYDNTLVVGTSGGPGAGKSTTASLVFGILKSLGIDAELAPEFAKDKTWEGSKHVLANQPDILGKQLHRLWRLNKKVEVILTDSPLFLSAIYNNGYGDELDALALRLYNDFDNVNYLMQRVKEYNPNGRGQTKEEAVDIDVKVRDFLDKHEIEYFERPGDLLGACTIAEEIYYKLRGKRLRATITLTVEE
jgi:hypothetical protein